MSIPTQIILLDELRSRCGGRVKTMVRVLESFITTAHEYVVKLENVDLAADEVLLAKTLHGAKGLLREVAAHEGAQFVETLELKAKQHLPVERDELLKVAEWMTAASADAAHAEQQLRATLP